MKIAVAGCGAITQAVYQPLLRRRPDLFDVTAVCDLSASLAGAVGDRLGADHRHTSFEEMLADGGFDAVVLLTSGSHGGAVRLALDQGYAVLCEKPLATTRWEAADLPGDRLMVGYMKQYDPAVRRAEAIISDPSSIRHLDVEVLHPSPASQLAFARLLPPPDDVPSEVISELTAADEAVTTRALGDAPEQVRRLYGICLGSICHDLSLMRRFTGSPATVDHVDMWGDAPGSVAVCGALPHGGRYSIRWHYLERYPAYRETVTIHHATGSAQLVFPSPYLLNAPTTLTVVSGADAAESRSEIRSVAEAFEEQLVAFHAFAGGPGDPPLTGPAGGLEDIVTAQRIAARYAAQNDLPIGGEAAT